MEIQRQRDQWSIRQASAERQEVNLDSIGDLLAGRSVMAGLHQAAPFNVPRMSPHEPEKIPHPSQNPDATHVEWQKYRDQISNPKVPAISGGPNPNRGAKGAPAGPAVGLSGAPGPSDRGLADVAWAASAPGFDLDADAAARTKATHDYADKIFAEEPWTSEEERYGNPDMDYYVNSPDDYIDMMHSPMDHHWTRGQNIK